jgi:hypothetical protein
MVAIFLRRVGSKDAVFRPLLIFQKHFKKKPLIGDGGLFKH